jgi:hypothetical protein
MQNSRITPPQLAIPGEPIRASYMNQIVRALRQALSRSIRGTGGVIVDQQGDSVVVSLAPGYRNAQLYRVAAVYVDGVDQELAKGASVEAAQGLITYDLAAYRAVERADILGVSPDMGRPTGDDTMVIRSANVGDPVTVYSLVVGDASERDLYVHILNERDADGEDCPEPEPEGD